ncbi:MAG: FAD-binding protein [Myxococcaceae bacterium]
MSAQELGSWARRVDGALVAEPADERELVEVIHVLADRGVKLHRDIALSRARLLAFGRVAERSMTVEVGAGWRLGELDEKLRPFGLTLGPLSPAAMHLRLGEFLEGPYAGHRSIPGGRLEALCSSLTALLPDGRRLSTSHAPRSAAGPDLTALVLGGHGRVAVVTSAVVRCLPWPERDVRATFSFGAASHFVTAMKRALAEGLWPWRVHVDSRSNRVVAEVRWASVPGAVERDRELLLRSVDGAGGRPSGDEEREAPLAVEHEATWDAVREALDAGRSLQLFRLSLATVIARGDVQGLALDGLSSWTSLAGRLGALDPRSLFGGAP